MRRITWNGFVEFLVCYAVFNIAVIIVLQETLGSASFLDNSQAKLPKIKSALRVPPISSYCNSCTLEFDGASKGNPGLAGAGAVLRAVDNSVVFRLREGVGTATNNAAEYRGCILGLKFALEKGFKHICVHGDSKLVCMQVQGAWKCKNQNMADLCKVAKELKDQFQSFEISHIDRGTSGWYHQVDGGEDSKEINLIEGFTLASFKATRV